MSHFHLQHLNRANYIQSIGLIKDEKTSGFATMCLEWWDKQCGWYCDGCIALSDESDAHLCYIFFRIDRYKEYVTIHNIFTPLLLRRNGYAYELLKAVFEIALCDDVKRFKFVSISKSLDFYLSLGFIYWGLNSVGDYYCDLPMPKLGLEGVKEMTQKCTVDELLGKKLDFIFEKVMNNEAKLSSTKQTEYIDDKNKMKESYMFAELSDIKKASSMLIAPSFV